MGTGNNGNRDSTYKMVDSEEVLLLLTWNGAEIQHCFQEWHVIQVNNIVLGLVEARGKYTNLDRSSLITWN